MAAVFARKFWFGHKFNLGVCDGIRLKGVGFCHREVNMLPWSSSNVISLELGEVWSSILVGHGGGCSFFRWLIVHLFVWRVRNKRMPVLQETKLTFLLRKCKGWTWYMLIHWFSCPLSFFLCTVLCLFRNVRCPWLTENLCRRSKKIFMIPSGWTFMWNGMWWLRSICFKWTFLREPGCKFLC